MSPEGIRLFFTNFPLVSVSHHNANYIAIFRHNIYFHQYNSPAFLSISFHHHHHHQVYLSHKIIYSNNYSSQNKINTKKEFATGKLRKDLQSSSRAATQR